MDLGLRGLRAIVSGATRGIGRAIANTLAAEGVHVALCARQAAEVADTVAALHAQGVTAVGRALDVSDAAALQEWVTASAQELGGLDIVIPNVSALAIGSDEASWRKEFEVDMLHTVRMVTTAMPYLEQSQHPAIVTISSVSGREIDFAAGPYGALKAARKDFSGARGEYERALQLDANSLEALAGLVALDLSQKNVAAARARVETRLAAQPDRADLLGLAARMYLAGRDMGKAEGVLRHLIEVDPGNMNGYAMLGQVYLAQRKLDEAKAEFDKRASANPKDAPSRLVVAMILEMQQKVPEAKQKYEEVLAIDSRSLIAANNLAYIYAQARENLDRALALAQTAVERAPNSPEVRDTLGWVYYQKELPELALRAFEESAAKSPDNPIFHYHLGLALAKQGNLVRARRSHQTALKLKPDYADAQQALKAIGG